jgi:hypothetical protein
MGIVTARACGTSVHMRDSTVLKGTPLEMRVSARSIRNGRTSMKVNMSSASRNGGNTLRMT